MSAISLNIYGPFISVVQILDLIVINCMHFQRWTLTNLRYCYDISVTFWFKRGNGVLKHQFFLSRNNFNAKAFIILWIRMVYILLYDFHFHVWRKLSVNCLRGLFQMTVGKQKKLSHDISNTETQKTFV